MKRFRPIQCLGLIFTILGIGIALPLRGESTRTNQANWENLGMIAHGDTVMVVLNGAQSIQGKFENFTPDSITLHDKSGEQSFKRENVLRVSARGQKHRGRNALIAALIGAGAGLGIGAMADRRSRCGPSGPLLCGLFPNLGKEAITPIGATVGVVVGLALPTGRWHEIYRAH